MAVRGEVSVRIYVEILIISNLIEIVIDPCLKIKKCDGIHDGGRCSNIPMNITCKRKLKREGILHVVTYLFTDLITERSEISKTSAWAELRARSLH
jgi:hypothetical protein